MIHRVRVARDRTQLRYENNFYSRIREKNTDLVPGDSEYDRHQKFEGNKLKMPVKGPFQSLHSNGNYVIVQTHDELQRISLNDCTPRRVDQALAMRGT